MAALVISVRLHEGWYQGQPEWPPSPARVFQALVAAVGLSGRMEDAERRALEWLERLDPPIVCAPRSSRAKATVVLYVPNNDSDRLKEAQTGKREAHGEKKFQPHLFDASVPFRYAWILADEAETDHARTICRVAERLYQLGRGMDMAWAWGEIVADDELKWLLVGYPGHVYRPSVRAGGTNLRCPCVGTLESLRARHQAFAARFAYERKGKKMTVTHRRPPNPRFHVVPYEAPPSRQVFELHHRTGGEGMTSWPSVGAGLLVTRLRDAAVERLKSGLPSRASEIDRVLVGRKPDGSNSGRTADRVRIIPLASIGRPHADMQIRRVLVEVPPTCPLRAEDVYWAFSGLELKDGDEGEVVAVLSRAADNEFAKHYGVETDESYRVWRTITPVALPELVARRGARSGSERSGREQRAAAALAQALRHAEVRAQVAAVRVQREPFHIHGARAEDFSPETRFSPNRLWHVEVTLDRGVAGPLVIGDGRFLGLGVMAPVLFGLEADFGATEWGPLKT